MWLCYLLGSKNSNKTYVGATVNLFNRLDAHNSKKRGAKYTRGEEWEILCFITGFQTKQQCLSFEKNFQRMRRYRKKTGYKYGRSTRINRYLDLMGLVNKKWSKYVIDLKSVPLKINIIDVNICPNKISVPEYICREIDFDNFDTPF